MSENQIVGSPPVNEHTIDATVILNDLRDGDETAAERLLPLVYEELRAIAGSLFTAQPNGHSLQPTALVHEAYLRLVRQDGATFADQAHFLAVAAIAMRQILVDHARARAAEKRGGDRARVTLDLAAIPEQDDEVDVLALHDALKGLRELDERKAKVVELRFFGGLTMEQVSTALGISRGTATTDWRFARAWIVRELRGVPPE